MKKCEDLLNQSSHIQHSYETHRSEKKIQNRLHLKTSIDNVRWLAFQACAFRGHDEGEGLKNRGNFIEMLKILASYNNEVVKVMLENAPYNTKYTSDFIQKEILSIFASKVRTHIRKEIEDAKFCILVDQSRDEAKREKMAIVLRFVDIDGFIKERFLDLVHVKDTAFATLKKELCKVCFTHGLDVFSIRGQGYDGLEVPDLNAPYCARRGQPKRDMTLKEYYRVDTFFVTINKELTDLNSRFNENSMELLTLCNSLVPKDRFKSFDIDQISMLVDKFYPIDFSNQEKILLKFQLQHFIIETWNYKELRDLSTISELWIAFGKSEKSKVYFLVDQLICLILTLSISTINLEGAFSAMKIVKIRLCNRMEDEFLADILVIYIEKEIAEKFDTDSIIEDFKNMKKYRAKF